MPIPFDKQLQYGVWNTVFFDTVGDGSGDTDQAIDGSVTPVEFKITAPEKEHHFIHQLTGLLSDSGSFDSGGYGNNGGHPLTNGIKFIYTDIFGIEHEWTEQYAIKTNVDYGVYCYDITYHSFGSGDTSLLWRYDMSRDGAPFWLAPGTSIVIRISDDLTFLTKQITRAGMISAPSRYITGK
jgi:hypothetical protein